MSNRALVFAVVLVAGCSSSALPIGSGSDGGADLSASPPPHDLAVAPHDLPPEQPTKLVPIPPTAATHMYQGGQWWFQSVATPPCQGRAVAGMGDNAFCFAAFADTVKCAGTIGGVSFGMRFSTVPGQVGARQILISPTSNSAAGNSICILKIDGTASCMGYNANGPFGDGDTAPTTSFVSWGNRTDLVAIGTGTWDQMCALTSGGTVYCAGAGFSTTPVAQSGTHTSFWVDTTGQLVTDDPKVVRPEEGRTDCRIIPTGLACPMALFGPTDGTLVNGYELGPALGVRACWLTAGGSVNCTDGPRFANGQVVHIAVNPYTDSMCAIYSDGSVWCIGSNAQGKLGTGDTNQLAVETQVAPPGSALARCD